MRWAHGAGIGLKEISYDQLNKVRFYTYGAAIMGRYGALCVTRRLGNFVRHHHRRFGRRALLWFEVTAVSVTQLTRGLPASMVIAFARRCTRWAS